MNDAQDLYAILGVPPNATLEDIRRAYRNAARRLHPDVNKSPGAATQFRDIAAAYGVLGEETTKYRYDAQHKRGPEKALLNLRVTPSKQILPVLDEVQVLYLLVDLVPDKARMSRPAVSPLNLTLVLDHSTSMKGVRIERTKSAAYQIIDQLTPDDYLSVVSFSDHAEVLIESTKVTDKPGLKGNLMVMQPSGGTEIFQGLVAGYKENQRNASPRFVNHIILLTDGRTYGDEAQCLDLAEQATKNGVGISAMGIGDEWNDSFLDMLATRTGGSSAYINSPNAVVSFLNDRVKTLGQSFAERITLSLAPDPDIKVESAFRLSPNPQPLSVAKDPIPVGQMPTNSSTSIILQIQIPPGQVSGARNLIRLEMTMDILTEQLIGHKLVADAVAEFSPNPPPEDPPVAILDALGKLTLYRMQEKANAAVSRGDVQEATRQLENLATRLISAGHEELGNAARAEADRVSKTHMLSDEGQKALKYGTRFLLNASSDGNPGTTGNFSSKEGVS